MDQVNILMHTAEVKRPERQRKAINKLREKHEAEDMCTLYGRKNEGLDSCTGSKIPRNEDTIVKKSNELKSQVPEEEDMNKRLNMSGDSGPSIAYIAQACTLKHTASLKSEVSYCLRAVIFSLYIEFNTVLYSDYTFSSF